MIVLTAAPTTSSEAGIGAVLFWTDLGVEVIQLPANLSKCPINPLRSVTGNCGIDEVIEVEALAVVTPPKGEMLCVGETERLLLLAVKKLSG